MFICIVLEYYPIQKYQFIEIKKLFLEKVKQGLQKITK